MSEGNVAISSAPSAPGTGRRVAFHTLGCKVNFYDTEAVSSLFTRAGYDLVDFADTADVYIINTCSVTNTGARKSRQVIRRAINRNPAAIVVAMGCYAQYAPDEVGAIPGVDLVVGTHRRAELVDLVEEVRRTQRPVHAVVDKIFKVTEYEEMPAVSFEGRTRAVLKIQDGCNEFCAFCQIPWARGRNRSRLPHHVQEQATYLAEAGYKEIILTGVHLGTYGVDLDEPMNLARIIQLIHDTPGLERIRISSVDPHEVTDELIETVAGLPKVCRHLHVPTQAGDDDVLLLMRRRNSVAEFHAMAEQVRHRLPDIALTTDIIVGFPGETDERFENTLQFCEDAQFSKIHVFPYSRRKGTLAERLPGHVSDTVREERTQRLLELSDASSLAFHQTYVGEEVEVLVEGAEAHADHVEGFTDTYVRVRLPGDDRLSGRLVRVKVKEALHDHVLGDIVA